MRRWSAKNEGEAKNRNTRERETRRERKGQKRKRRREGERESEREREGKKGAERSESTWARGLTGKKEVEKRAVLKSAIQHFRQFLTIIF